MSGVSIDELARQTGVSRATVARILGTDIQYNRPAFAKRAQRIRKLAEEMGYRPNAAAKAISTGRFRHVALVMGTHYERSNFTREMLRGIHDALRSRGMHMSLWFLDDQQLDDENQLPVFLREQMVDGLLINYTHEIPPHMVSAIEQASLPVVWVNVRRPSACVYPDDLAAGRQAVDYLRGLGHRRIAYADFIHGSLNTFKPHYSVGERYRGYQAAMRAAALTPQVFNVSKMLPGPQAVARATELLRIPSRPTAIVCQAPRDVRIFEVAAARIGLRIPEDLSLITFGGERLPDSVMHPTLLAEPREEMGRTAAEALLERIEGRGDFPGRPIPYHLIEAETTAKPAASQ